MKVRFVLFNRYIHCLILGHEESGSLEHLAVRFKHKDVAEDFKEKFEKCQSEIGEVVSETVVVPSASVEETAEEGDEDYEGYEDEEDYDENGETIMFHQAAILHIKNENSGEFMSQVITRVCCKVYLK